MSKPILTQEYIKKFIYYDAVSGWMSWNGKKKWTKRGNIGYLNKNGYRVVMINKSNYAVHRLAWIYVYGEIAAGLQIDHINHDRSDNRIVNLRLVTNQENQMNRRFTGNSSGFRGVYWLKSRNRWGAKIKFNQKINNLGSYIDLEEAISMRLTAEDHYGFHNNHGTELTI